MPGDHSRFGGELRPSDQEGREFGIWLTYAITLACVGTGVLAVFAWSWAWDNGAFDADRIDILSRFAAYLVAAVTFCTVVWRGLISAKQAEYQQEQLDSLTRQIASTEENNFAQLLQKGAELVEDETKFARVNAGIAILQAVAEAPNDKFREQARGLIAYFIRAHGRYAHLGRGVNLAISAFNSIYNTTRVISPTSFYFEEDAEEAARTPEQETDWKIIYGAAEVVYAHGNFAHTVFARDLPTGILFRRVAFGHCTFVAAYELDMFHCYFYRCRFHAITTRMLSSHRFNECDFSGIKIIRDTNEVPSLIEGNNWYDPDNPPTGSDGRDLDWDAMFVRGKPPSEFPF